MLVNSATHGELFAGFVTVPLMAAGARQTRQAKPTKADMAAADRLRALWRSKAPALGLTQEKLAAEMDITQGAVSQYIAGLIPLNYRALMAFSKALECNATDIRSDLPEQLLVGTVPKEEDWRDVHGYAQAAGLGAAGAEATEYAESHKLKFKASSLRRKGLQPGNLAVFYGSGDSMLPRIHPGDAILFDTSDTRPRDGVLFVIQVPSAANPDYQVKRALLLDDAVFFAADNPSGDHEWTKPRKMEGKRGEQIKIIGRVRWIGSWED